jgi:hypothetical protein
VHHVAMTLATVAEETEADPFAGGAVLVIGFILVGAVAAYVAARLARKSRGQWDDD